VTEDDEIILAFLEESRENLDRLDQSLVDLEAHPGDPELLSSVFRTVHTIKGTCGFLGFARLEALTHVGENLLGSLRDGDLVIDVAITTSLLTLIDTIRAALDGIQSTGAEDDDEHSEVIADLTRHIVPVRPGPPDVEATVTVTSATEIEQTEVEPAVSADEAVTDLPAAAVETSVRIDVTVLDDLLNLVGELVLASSQVDEFGKERPDGPLATCSRQLRLVTDELQGCVMEARLQPVGLVTAKFRRIARDLATSLGKQVAVEIEGEDVGVDKAVNEALKDPLLHLVRNAIDHGIEPPSEREASGKPALGQLSLRASQENGRVHVEISDDGRGIDTAHLLQKAVSMGLFTNEEASELTVPEVLRLIFLPGLSTKEKVSQISGRGVGMDAVRISLESVGGSIDVSSYPGRGTVFTVTIPLTLSIMPVLITWCAGQRYAIPQVAIQEVVRLEQDEIATVIDDIGGAQIYNLRGQLLPLVDLADALGLVPASNTRGSVAFVVVETEGRCFGIVVDSVGDAMEAVVKPLTSSIRSIPIFGGVTILGDGGLSLILDIGGLATAAGIDSRTTEGVPVGPGTTHCAASSVLLVTGSDGVHFALRLEQVDRLVHFDRELIERTGALDVIRYHGGILPLFSLADLLPERDERQLMPSATDTGLAITTVICDSPSGLVGLVVDTIEDIVPEPIAVAQPPGRRGVTSSLILNEMVVELLDVDALVADARIDATA
jgi:two-component system chemotaxis sensor kinase CheA